MWTLPKALSAIEEQDLSYLTEQIIEVSAFVAWYVRSSSSRSQGLPEGDALSSVEHNSHLDDFSLTMELGVLQSILGDDSCDLPKVFSLIHSER